MKSLWNLETQLEERRQLEGTVQTDVAIIGAGMAGVLTAWFLQQQGLNVTVLEAERIAGGQTGHTTAKITAQHGLIYHRLLTERGEDAAGQYARMNLQAVQKFEDLIGQEQIDCHFEKKPTIVYTRQDEKAIEQEVKAAVQLGLPVEFTTQTTLPFEVKAAVRMADQAQFQPLEFLQGLSRNLTVYEHSPVTGIDGTTLETPHGKVIAQKVVVASHYPFWNTPGYYFLRMHQERSYVLALEHAAQLDGMYLEAEKFGYSFRNSGSFLLLGGAGHRTGENLEGGRYETLRKAAKEWYPEARETAFWSAQDCITLDGTPYIGKYSSSLPGIYVATGFNKWGMTGSMVSAMLLSDRIIGRETPDAAVFSPERFTITASMKNLMTDGAQAIKGLSKEVFLIPETQLEDLAPGHGGVVEYEGRKIGAYRNEESDLFLVSVRCPHLGCQLEWNPDEKSWDCPCHGSRFDYHGELMDNPATKNLEGI